MHLQPIRTPDDHRLEELCQELSGLAPTLDLTGDWPARQLELCGQYGVYRWFLPGAWGGFDWSESELVRGYLRLSAACLATAFILTQRSGACRRILGSENDALKARLLPGLAAGDSFATLGISHLTTSRRHLGRPALSAREVPGGFVLDGFSAWVTGARQAQTIATGAVLDDGRQILVALPTDLPGVETGDPARLIALSSSQTGEVRCRQVMVENEWLLAGPAEDVMKQGGANTGGLQTSALAIGLATAAIGYLRQETSRRADLAEPTAGLQADRDELEAGLLHMAAGEPVCSPEELRARANSLALRATQAALAAAKGSGYVQGHPAGRWCREALFFLVWSCPQPVVAANLCELAGLSD